jgi:2-isopropylmalate synthase
VQEHSEQTGDEVSGSAIQALFQERYVNRDTPWQLRDYQLQTQGERVGVRAQLQAPAQTPLQTQLQRTEDGNGIVVVNGTGAGALEALVNAIGAITQVHTEIVDYHEHALQQGTGAKAVCYLQVGLDDRRCWGVGIADDTVRAAFAALLSAVNNNAIRNVAAA